MSTKIQLDSKELQRYFRLARPRIFRGKPLIEEKHMAVYQPPTTNAQMANPVTGMTTPITSVTALILFSSDSDVAAMFPLLKAMDPNTTAFDGSGIVCPPVIYGSDGRKINCFSGTINGEFYETAVGILLAQKNWGPMWNYMHQPPYNSLVADALDATDAQVDWTT